MESKVPGVNQWLIQMYNVAELESEGLRGTHPSKRDNAVWRAEAAGKIDACARLKSVHVSPQKVDDVRKELASHRPRGVSDDNLDRYRDGAEQILKGCEDYLKRHGDGT